MNMNFIVVGDSIFLSKYYGFKIFNFKCDFYFWVNVILY